jgi:hypothetical protein
LLRLQAANRTAAETHLRTSRLTRLRAILHLPDLAEVRQALAEVIVQVQIDGGGGTLMMVGDGPLEPLPGDDIDPRGSLGTAKPKAACAAPGPEPRGSGPRSRLCVVGATGFEPARCARDVTRACGRGRLATGLGKYDRRSHARARDAPFLGGCAPYGARCSRA